MTVQEIETKLKDIQEQKEWAIRSQRYERAADLREEEGKLLEELKLLTSTGHLKEKEVD